MAWLKNYSTHWVGLDSKVTINMFGARRVVQPFKVYTWGGQADIPPGRPGVDGTATRPRVPSTQPQPMPGVQDAPHTGGTMLTGAAY